MRNLARCSTRLLERHGLVWKGAMDDEVPGVRSDRWQGAAQPQLPYLGAVVLGVVALGVRNVDTVQKMAV